jgi:threonine/homoserine/homoserine lactone efflux protein
MTGTHDLWLFAATVLVVNATPGVDLLLTLTRTLEHGVRGGLRSALGIGSGCVLHALAAAFGLAALLAASAEAFTVVKWAGAAYLLWLAVGMLRSAARPALATAAAGPSPATAGRSSPVAADTSSDVTAVTARAPASSPWRLYRQGVLTNALNPKVALFFLALLPQFIDAAAPHKTLAFLFLGAWFVVQGTVFLAALVLLAAPLQHWQPSPAVARSLQALGGTIFVGLALKLALAERH